MKNLFAIALMVVGLACGTTKNAVNAPALEVVKATRQAWMGGAYGSGQGHYYRVVLVPEKGKIDDTLHFDTVYTDGRAFTPEVSIDEGAFHLAFEYSQRPKRDDNGVLMEGDVHENPPKAHLYPDFEGAALVVGRFDGKRFSVAIDSFTNLQPLAYP